VVRLPWGYGTHLKGAHDVVLDGINVSFALVGYQIEPDGEAEATNNILRGADIDHNTYDGDGVWVWQATVISTLAAWKRASGAVADEEDDPGFTSLPTRIPNPRTLVSLPRARAWTAVTRFRPFRRTSLA
jgi:hypothetical protein